MTRMSVSVPTREVQNSPVVFQVDTGRSRFRVLYSRGGVEMIEADHTYGQRMTHEEFRQFFKQFGHPNRTSRRVRRRKCPPDAPALLAG